VEAVALIASVFSIGLAIVAIWLAIHHKDQSDKLNRDTAEKLARIEAFATSIKEDAFGEIKRYGDFWRAGGKAWEEAEKAKEKELRKLKDEIQMVGNKLSSLKEAPDISEIKKEFERLKLELRESQGRLSEGIRSLEQKERKQREAMLAVKILMEEMEQIDLYSEKLPGFEGAKKNEVE